MKRTIDEKPLSAIIAPMLPPMPPPLDQYEELELRHEFRRALRRARLRSALGSIIAGLCGLYERLGLGRPTPRPLPARDAARDAAQDAARDAAQDAVASPPPATVGIDELAGTIDARGRIVVGPPRLSRRDYGAWASAYAAVRERGPGPIRGRFVDGVFYLDADRRLAIRVEAARALGYDTLQAVGPSSGREPAIMAS